MDESIKRYFIIQEVDRSFSIRDRLISVKDPDHVIFTGLREDQASDLARRLNYEKTIAVTNNQKYR